MILNFYLLSSISSYNFHVSLAASFQLNILALSRLFLPISSLSSGFVNILSMDVVKLSISIGFIIIPASPTTSGNDDVFEVITGTSTSHSF